MAKLLCLLLLATISTAFATDNKSNIEGPPGPSNDQEDFDKLEDRITKKVLERLGDDVKELAYEVANDVMNNIVDEGSDQSDEDLKEAGKSDQDLEEANQSDKDLKEANQSDKDLKEADQSDEDLKEADQSDEDLTETDQSDEDLKETDEGEVAHRRRRTRKDYKNDPQPFFWRRRRRRRQSPPASNGCTSVTKHANGCGGKGWEKIQPILPYSGTLKAACDKHDICYYCGQKWGTSRKSCDDTFLNDQRTLCSRKFSWWQFTARLACYAWSKQQYVAVQAGGNMFWSNPSPSWCEESCVKHFGSTSRAVKK